MLNNAQFIGVDDFIAFISLFLTMKFDRKPLLKRYFPILLLLCPILFFGLEWPNMVVQNIDHCDIAMCDFVRHYMPQANALWEDHIDVVRGWFYPPFLAILLMPLSIFEEPRWVWLGGNLCALFLMIRLAIQQTRLPWWLVGIVMCLSLPVLHALKWGQISLILSALIVLGVCSQKRLAWYVAAAGALKVYPIALGGIFLLEKDWKGLFVFALLFVAFAMLFPALLLGLDATILMWRHVFDGAREVRGFAPHGGGQGLYPVLYRLFFDGSHTQLAATELPRIFRISLLWLEVLWGIGVICIIVFTRRRFVLSRDRIARLFVLWVALHLLLSPGWHHYTAFLPFVLLWCWSRGEYIWSGLGLLIILLPVMILGIYPGTYAYYSAFGGTFWAVFCAWIALLRICGAPGSENTLNCEELNVS